MSEHAHRFVPPKPGESYITIDTSPPQYPYTCECGAVTHDPTGDEPFICRICSRMDADKGAGA